jgi:hypothetical protein
MWGLLRIILLIGNVLLLGIGRGEDRLSVYGLAIFLALNFVYLSGLGDQLIDLWFDAKENDLHQRADPKIGVLLRIILLIGNASILALLAYLISYKYTVYWPTTLSVVVIFVWETYGLLIFLALNFVYLLLANPSSDARRANRTTMHD